MKKKLVWVSPPSRGPLQRGVFPLNCPKATPVFFFFPCFSFFPFFFCFFWWSDFFFFLSFLFFFLFFASLTICHFVFTLLFFSKLFAGSVKDVVLFVLLLRRFSVATANQLKTAKCERSLFFSLLFFKAAKQQHFSFVCLLVVCCF